MPNINIFCQLRFSQTSVRQPSPQNELYQPLLSSSPRGQANTPPNPTTNSGTGGSSSSRQPVEIRHLLPTQTTNTQNGKSPSKTSKRLAEILDTLENASSYPNTIKASITEISELGVHNTPTPIRKIGSFWTNRGNNSQQYNLAHPTSSDTAYNQLDLLNNIVTKLIEIKNKNKELKANVVDCLLNLRKCIDTHDTLDKTRSNNNQKEVRDEIRKNIKADEEVSKRYREIVLEAVRKNFYELKNVSEELRGDRQVVMEAVKQNGVALQYASEELRGDRQVVMEAVKQDGRALQYASEGLRGDRQVVMDAVKQNAAALQYASEELRGDREFVMAAVKQNAAALQYASEELRGDREVVMEAVKKIGWALGFASNTLQADKEVVMEAVKKDCRALQYASEKLRRDIKKQRPDLVG
jgi:hypothetical protein